jgi:DNA repair exonuclease SbcCD ATPase subunit
MEIEELEKRIGWLDSERQKDKKLIAELSDSLEAIEENNRKQNQKLKLLETDIKATGSTSLRVERVDTDFAEFKTETLRLVSELDKKLPIFEKKYEKQRIEDIGQINNKLLEHQTDMKVLAELKKTLQARIDEEIRINQKVDDVAKSFPELHVIDTELQRQQKLLNNDIHLENKRISDLQIETSTIRKRIEEDLIFSELFKESLRKVEQRVNEFHHLDQERKQNQATFIEKQSLLQVEKENLWKDWQGKFAEMEALGPNFNTQLLSLEETHRSVKNSLSELAEVNERFNRRINEITEMNRLNEERFRQEWVSFKADDQKRWTNYNLTIEEERREVDRQRTRFEDRLINLEDASQEFKDALQATHEEIQKQIKGYLTLSQELLDSFVQSLGKRK